MKRAGVLSVAEGRLETGWWGPEPEDAPTLVLLHEGLGCVDLWRDVPERLTAATGCGVFAYSRFGYGRSDLTPLPRPMDYMQQEAMLVLPQVLSQTWIRQAVLVGHSDGGSIAAIHAGAIGSGTCSRPRPGSPPPDRVVRALVEGRGSGEGSPSTTDGGTAREVAGGSRIKSKGAAVGGTGILAEPKIEPLHRPPGSGYKLLGLITIAAHFFVEDLNIGSIRRIKQDYETGDLRQRLAHHHRNVDVAFRGWNDTWLDPRFRTFDITGFLRDIHVPILGLQGADDPYGSGEQLRVLQANVRAPIEVSLIPGARHAPHLEAKEATLAAITRFITGLPRGTPT